MNVPSMLPVQTSQQNKARVLVVCLAGLLAINVLTLGIASWCNISRASARGKVESVQSITGLPQLEPALEAAKVITVPKVPLAAPQPRSLPIPKTQEENVPQEPLPPSEKPNLSLLRLVNPGETGGEVHYAVDGTPYSLSPGEYHELPRGAALQVDFHRGEDYGDANLVLREGVYIFRVGSTGWELAAGKAGFGDALKRAH